MMVDQPGNTQNIRMDAVPFLSGYGIDVAVLRLDLMHPVISGNKWFKLKEYLKDARSVNKSTLLTFGGAFSNHILATAAAAKQSGLDSIGVIRGERPGKISGTLEEAAQLGMRIYFSPRKNFRDKKIPPEVFSSHPEHNIYVIPEGGYGSNGAKGARDILSLVHAPDYTHFIVAVGTGTTLAGLTEGLAPGQQLLGVSVFRNNYSLETEISELISASHKGRFQLLHDYHFGGYARCPAQLTDWMNQWYLKTGIPSDFVYTAKLFFAVSDLARNGFFAKGSRILVVHTGGLQGNRSLPKGTLIF